MLTRLSYQLEKRVCVMKKADDQANTWLFKVVILFIVAGFLLSLIPLAKTQSVHQRSEHLLNDFDAQGTQV